MYFNQLSSIKKAKNKNNSSYMNDIKNIKKRLDCDEQSMTNNRNNQNISHTNRSNQNGSHINRSNYKVNDESLMNDHTHCRRMMNGILQKIR